MNEENTRPFTSRMSRGETIAALVYLPVHAVLLPVLIGLLLLRGLLSLSDAVINLAYYAIGIVYMLLLERKFLRRDFDALCDGFGKCLVQICACYGIMLLLNLAVNGLLSLMPQNNPNNAAVMDMAGAEMGKVAAMAVFLAPIVEELMFRAGVFGLIRRRSRVLAYVVSILLFSVYHVWSYLILDPGNWIYILQYIPASYVLCRCYERSDSIWGSIFLHMLINGVSLWVLSALGTL